MMRSRLTDCLNNMRLLSSFILALSCTVVSAQPSQEQRQLATQLVDLLDCAAAFDAAVKQCKQPSGTHFDPKFLFATDPSSFGGVSPKSSYWPEVEAAYRKYQNTVCSYLSAEDFARYYIEGYANHLSADDLRAAIAFHSSPAGQRLKDVGLSVNESFQAYAHTALQSVYKRSYKEVQHDLSAVLKKYEQEPR